eukprot:CAMPEP_0117688102 /NCGR_PEP_ID=MMETSP0804-20121206/23601_1 /TAXON_ID=1074897 /ORGANISM="Tetraselmis astigmatica, Strain CCMP880" /LENGTH=49 /DNA_ID= /DNA_START= /DNA_END= /DNA_ORIENTATION=
MHDELHCSWTCILNPSAAASSDAVLAPTAGHLPPPYADEEARKSEALDF